MSSPYTQEERVLGQRRMIQEGVFSRAMEGFTGGVILAGFALALGATDFEIGLLAAVPFLSQLAHIPAVLLLRRYPEKKPLVVGSAALARSLFFLVALVPLVSLPIRPVSALIPLLVAYATIATMTGAGWHVWVREMVPRDGLGRYFGKRMAILSTVGLVVVVGAGLVVQWWSDRHPDRVLLVYSALFASGAVMGLVSTALLSRAPCKPTWTEVPRPLRQLLREPLRDRNYRGVLFFLGSWSLGANLLVPFMSVVMLRTMGHGVGTVTMVAALSTLANIGGLRLWAPLTDRFGNKPVLGLAGSVFVLALLGWLLMPKTDATGALVAAGAVHLVMGFAIAGLDVASNGIVMKLASEDDAPAYLASASVVKAVSAGVAPLLGGLALTGLGDRAFSIRFAWGTSTDETAVTALRIAGHDFLAVAALFICLYALHRLLAFHEEGEAPPEQVVRAMRRDVATPGSVAGMRQFAHAASYLVEAAYRFERTVVSSSERKLREK